MQSRSSDSEAPDGPRDRQVAPRPMRYGWSTFDGASVPLVAAALEQAVLPTQEPINSAAHVLSANVPVASRATAFELPKDKTITISLIAGPSKGMTHQFHKARISIGRAGGGADIEIDDSKVSRLHCALGVSHGSIRLCDLHSTTGTYVDDELVEVAELGHLSEFRVGSSVLLITFITKREMGNE
jgi:Inner membrane component of T3SS, cytoplasmic domain